MTYIRVAVCLLAAAVAFSNVEAAGAGDLVLVDQGVSRAPIVIFADAPPMTRRAANELADYIEKISGARPDVIEGEPDPLPPHAIWVGYQPRLKELFPRLDFNFQHPEEILIASNDRHLVIAGRDRWDPEHLVVDTGDSIIKGKQQEYGTINAVYTFLQDRLQVRWLWPGELGEDIPKQSTISVPAGEYRYHPRIRARGGVFHFSVLGNRGYGRSQEWTRLQRLQLDSLTIGGGHAFGDWWERFGKDRPELFALQPDGTRGTYPSPGNMKLCQSNPQVWRQWLADVAESLKQDPNQTVFNASPNDGWSSGHCVCEKCSAWDHPDGEPRLFHWKNHREERPALTDRDITFANHLQELLKERYPDKDYYVLMMSYGHSRPAPVEARPGENVIISSVANFYGRTNLVDRGSTRGTTHREQFAAWCKIARNLTWRPNTGSPAGWQQGLPDLSINQMIDDFKLVGESQCTGIFIDSVWEHWATQGPQYYVMAQLVWNPRQEGQAILDDYYRRGFGPAAEDVRAYYQLLEQARMAHVEQHGYGGGFSKLPLMYTDELLQSAETHLQAAAAKVQEGPPVFRRRVEFVKAGLAFTRLAVENARLMAGYWQKKDEAVAKQVRGNWEVMERLAQDHPYSLNWGPLRPSTSRMLGLHPDYPNPKWKPASPKDLDLD